MISISDAKIVEKKRIGKIKQPNAYLRGIFTKGSLLTHLKNATTVITNKGKLIYQTYNKELSIIY